MPRSVSEHDLPPIVVDSSVAIAYVRDEPVAARIRSAIAHWANDDRDLIVPSLFWYEVINPLARQHGFRSEDLLAAIDQLSTLEITTIDPDRALLLLTVDHVDRFDLTAYDANYLALATAYGAELATLDRRLAAAAIRPITFEEGTRLHETPAIYEREVSWPRYPGAAAWVAKLRAEALGGR